MTGDSDSDRLIRKDCTDLGKEVSVCLLLAGPTPPRLVFPSTKDRVCLFHQFLDASSPLRISLRVICPSVGPSVRPTTRPSVRYSVRVSVPCYFEMTENIVFLMEL